MDDPESIQSVSDLTQLLPATPSTSASSRGPPSASERPQRPSIRRIRNSSIRLSHTEPTSLIVRNRTVSTTDQNNENQTEEEIYFSTQFILYMQLKLYTGLGFSWKQSIFYACAKQAFWALTRFPCAYGFSKTS